MQHAYYIKIHSSKLRSKIPNWGVIAPEDNPHLSTGVTPGLDVNIKKWGILRRGMRAVIN
jgi:hypothetical protein